MTHRIHLLRHLKSSWDEPGLPDHDRPLAPRGRRAGKLVCRYLRTTDVAPQLVLCSSALRAVQTWEAIQGAISADVEVEITDELYGADAASLLRLLNGVSEAVPSVLVIGHNPGLEELAHALSGSGETAALDKLAAKYPTGALATLTLDGPWDGLAPGGAHLDRFVVPRELS
jgi:phosphohistidine phosphatase